jgi:hypothetical protein
LPENSWKSFGKLKTDGKFSFSPGEHAEIDYYETPRGAKGILCQGYYYVKEKAFGKTINW